MTIALRVGVIVLTAVGTGLLSFAGEALLQEEIHRSTALGGPSCPTCQVVVERVARLGGATNEEGLLCEDARLATAGGFFYVAPTCNPGEILVYDREGRVQRRFGNVGAGPGEISEVTRIWAKEGEVHVFDGPARRHLVFSLQGEFKRQGYAFAYPNDLVFLEDGRTVRQQQFVSEDRIGFPLHLFSTAGEILQSFGTATPEYDRENPLGMYRALAAAADGSIWSAHFQRYLIENWSVEGTFKASVTRDVPWFEPWTRYQVGVPTLRAIGMLDARHLLVLIQVPDPEWPDMSVRGSEPNSHTKRWDTMLEVIDTKDKTLVASARSPLLLTDFVDQSLVYSWAEVGPDLDVRMDVWRVRLLQEG